MTTRKKTIFLCGAALLILLGVMLYRGLAGKAQRERTETPITQSLLVTEEAVSGDIVSGDTVSGDAMTEKTGIYEAKGGESKKGKKKKSDSTSEPASKSLQKNDNSGKKNAGNPLSDTEKKSNRSSVNEKRKDKAKKETPSGNSGTTVQSGEKSESGSTSIPENTSSDSNKVKSTEKPKVSLISFEIQCHRIMNHKELWKDGIEEIIPENGIFYSGSVDYEEGKNVYDLLKKICKDNNIAMDSKYTPMYGTYYIQGIGNLYEFDCGEQSGWKYSVNGDIPNVGCSSYSVKEGDVIVFFYDYEI